MSNLNFDFAENDFRPLAARMRPTNLEQYYGQTHLIGEGKPLRKAIQAGHVHSMILWGPPGTGKTTLAEIIAHRINAEVERISAVTSGVKEIRESIERAKQNRLADRQTILFVDEVHRFNKSQQDAISDPERGLGKERLVLEENLLQVLAEYVNGDARLALNCLELMVDMAPETENGKKLDRTLLKEVLGERQARFDKQGDRFYDLISALHKSIRGSAADAALYWYARIITAGGDPLYVARRLLAIASEDVGNADPRAMQVALAAWDCFTRVGAYEGERAIAQAIIYLAVAPKSNAVYNAFNAAKQHAKEFPDFDVPPHLRNAPTALMKELGYGAEYRYAHDEPNAYAAGENYFPPELKDTQYYFPTNRGMEIQIKEKLERLQEQDKNASKKRYK